MNLINIKDFLCTKGYGFATKVVDAEKSETDIIEVYFDNDLIEECDSFEDAVLFANTDYWEKQC